MDISGSLEFSINQKSVQGVSVIIMTKEMKNSKGEIMIEGYCPIEDKITLWKKIENGKWVCISSGCSFASGQADYPLAKKRKEEYV